MPWLLPHETKEQISPDPFSRLNGEDSALRGQSLHASSAAVAGHSDDSSYDPAILPAPVGRQRLVSHTVKDGGTDQVVTGAAAALPALGSPSAEVYSPFAPLSSDFSPESAVSSSTCSSQEQTPSPCFTHSKDFLRAGSPDMASAQHTLAASFKFTPFSPTARSRSSTERLTAAEDTDHSSEDSNRETSSDSTSRTVVSDMAREPDQETSAATIAHQVKKGLEGHGSPPSDLSKGLSALSFSAPNSSVPRSWTVHATWPLRSALRRPAMDSAPDSPTAGRQGDYVKSKNVMFEAINSTGNSYFEDEHLSTARPRACSSPACASTFSAVGMGLGHTAASRALNNHPINSPHTQYCISTAECAAAGVSVHPHSVTPARGPSSSDAASILFATSSPVAHAFSSYLSHPHPTSHPQAAAVSCWEEKPALHQTGAVRRRWHTDPSSTSNSHEATNRFPVSQCEPNTEQEYLSRLRAQTLAVFSPFGSAFDQTARFDLARNAPSALEQCTTGSGHWAKEQDSMANPETRYCKIYGVPRRLLAGLSGLSQLRDAFAKYGDLRDVFISALTSEGWLVVGFHSCRIVARLAKDTSIINNAAATTVKAIPIDREEAIRLTGGYESAVLSPTEGVISMRYCDPTGLIDYATLHEFLCRFGELVDLRNPVQGTWEARWDDDRCAEAVAERLTNRAFADFSVEVRAGPRAEQSTWSYLTARSAGLAPPYGSPEHFLEIEPAVQRDSNAPPTSRHSRSVFLPQARGCASPDVISIAHPNHSYAVSPAWPPSTTPYPAAHALQRGISLFGPRVFPFPGVPYANVIDLERLDSGLETRTTLMIKNIPNKAQDHELIQMIHDICPRSISFFYLRFDWESQANVGYGFVNFISVDKLGTFVKARIGTKWGLCMSEKTVQLCYATLQGKEALVEKFRNSAVMDEAEGFRPKVFYSSGPMVGLPEPFPAPNDAHRKIRSQTAALNTRLNNFHNQLATFSFPH